MKCYYLDLFAGMGGFAVGAAWAGMKFHEHYYSEIDKFCNKLYQKRFPDAVALGDITKIKPEELPEGNWLLSGGFPCTNISVAGNQEGISGDQSKLWFEYRRLIRILRPRYAIIENVPGLTISGLDDVLASLASIGYNAEWEIISASDMGAPHKRERIWIVAYPDDKRCKKFNVAEVAEKKRLVSRFCSSRDRGLPDAHRQRPPKRVCEEQEERTTPRRCDEKRGADFWTLEPGISRVADGISQRVHRLKAIGNAVVPQITRVIFESIKEDYYNSQNGKI